jgi:VWFA-related protein
MRLVRALSLGVLLAGGALVIAQQLPTFRAQANFVEVDAIVVDKSGAFVPGLTMADFEVRENYSRQTVLAFAPIDLSTDTQPAAPITFDPNLPSREQIVAARIYLLYMDDVAAEDVSLARSTASQFVREFMQPGDVAAVWRSRSGASINVTNDKARLLREISAANGTAPADTSGVALQSASLSSAIEWMSGIQGRRKSLIFFSGGLNPYGLGQLNAFSGFMRGADVRWAIGPATGRSTGGDGTVEGRQLPDLLLRSDVHIYPVDIRGLVAPTRVAPVVSSPDHAAAELSRSHDTIWTHVQQFKELADLTGGLALINRNEFNAGFKKIVDDNSRYYLLGYQSTSKSKSGEFRRLEVKVKRSGLTVRARRGYVRW